MDDVVIRAENLSKRYRLGPPGSLYQKTRSLVGQLVRRWRGGAASTAPAKTFWALQDISLEIRRGEKVGIIGRNGAGKSTFLKILSRVVRPTRGWAEIHGRVGSLLEVGTGFHGDFTARQNIYLNGAVLGMHKREIDQKLDEIIAFAELERFVEMPVKYYSSGMFSRLAFSVAAHLDAEILLVDEVLSVGDAAFQKKSLGKMNELTGGGRTVLFVSHDLSSVSRLCQRAILLDKGQVAADGPAETVVEKYLESGGASRCVQNWSLEEAPGTEQVKLISAGLYKEDGSPARVVSVQDTLYLRIGYHVAAPNLRFRCCGIFYTDGVVAFGAMEPREEERPQPGLYYSTVKIPPHLLAEKEYVVWLSIFASRGVKNHYLTPREVLAFQVTDGMNGDSARGDYAERFAGVVRPRLEWNLEWAQQKGAA